MTMKDEEMERLFKQSMHLFVRDHMEKLSQELQVDNRSFVYLENNMLQMIMTYLFMNVDKKYENYRNEPFDTNQLDELEANLDSMIDKSKAEFEAVFDMLGSK